MTIAFLETEVPENYLFITYPFAIWGCTEEVNPGPFLPEKSSGNFEKGSVTHP